MSPFPRRMVPNTIVFQIASLVIVSLLLATAVTFAIASYQFRQADGRDRPETTAAEIVTVGRLAINADSPEELERFIAAGKSMGLDLRVVPLSALTSVPKNTPVAGGFLKTLVERMAQRADLVVLNRLQAQPGKTDSIVIKLAGQSALLVQLPPEPQTPSIFRGPTLFMFAMAVVLIGVFSVYALGWITAPLTKFSAAVEAFGQSLASDQHLEEKGPHEIAHAARALNVMRKRIRALVDERTYMLVAISHDLRTPLTRVVLHAERLPPSPARDKILSDLSKIREMISDTLTYSIAEGGSEKAERVDLPSLLQTICAEFTDVGQSVHYLGVDRFVYTCRPRGLLRALTNVVENATRHASNVTIALRLLKNGAAQIDVSDDGPGIPAAMREKVFEPFFRRDNARPSLRRGGFGLGLTIARDIVKSGGGDVQLFDNAPRGLTVRMTLPADYSLAGDTRSAATNNT